MRRCPQGAPRPGARHGDRPRPLRRLLRRRGRPGRPSPRERGRCPRRWRGRGGARARRGAGRGAGGRTPACTTSPCLPITRGARARGRTDRSHPDADRGRLRSRHARGDLLSHPDRNGLELAADRPRERWPASLGVRPRPARLEVDGLLAVIAASERRRPAEPGVAVGHLHPHVRDVEQGLPSTLDAVGFEAMVRLPSAAFVAAAIAITALTCGEVGVPAPAGVVGLRHWTVELPTSSDVAALR
jgi:hypothetical protein